MYYFSPLLFYFDKGHVNVLDSNSIGAIAGFNFNDGVTVVFQTLPNSGTDDVTLLTTTSNVGNPGVWMFEVDEVDIGSKCACVWEESSIETHAGNKASRQWFKDTLYQVSVYLLGPFKFKP